MGVPFYNLKFRGNNPAGGFNPVDYGNEREAEGEAEAAPAWTRLLFEEADATSGSSSFTIDSETSGSDGLTTASIGALFGRDPSSIATHYWRIPGVVWGDPFSIRIGTYVQNYDNQGSTTNPRQGFTAFLTHKVFSSSPASADVAAGFGFQHASATLVPAVLYKMNTGVFTRAFDSTAVGAFVEPFYYNIDLTYSRDRTFKAGGIDMFEGDGTLISAYAAGVDTIGGFQTSPYPEGEPVYLAFMPFGENSSAANNITSSFRLSYCLFNGPAFNS
jgi:hypothetical protein